RTIVPLLASRRSRPVRGAHTKPTAPTTYGLTAPGDQIRPERTPTPGPPPSPRGSRLQRKPGPDAEPAADPRPDLQLATVQRDPLVHPHQTVTRIALVPAHERRRAAPVVLHLHRQIVLPVVQPHPRPRLRPRVLQRVRQRLLDQPERRHVHPRRRRPRLPLDPQLHR